jgi:hypothetical protein
LPHAQPALQGWRAEVEKQLIFAPVQTFQLWCSCCFVWCVPCLLQQGHHQQTLQGKFLLQVDEVVNIAAGLKDRSAHHHPALPPLWFAPGHHFSVA